MAASDGGFDLLFGKIAEKKGLMTAEQVELCVGEQARLAGEGARESLGATAARKGFLTEPQREAITRAQRYVRSRAHDMRIGRLLVRNEFVTEEQLEEALDHQRSRYQSSSRPVARLLEILTSQGTITEQQAEAILTTQQRIVAATSKVKAKRRSARFSELLSKPKRDPALRVRRMDERFLVRDCTALFAKAKMLSTPKTGLQKCRPLDLSRSGVQLVSRTKLAEGDTLALKLDVPAFAEPLRLRGKVMWVERIGNTSTFRAGVKFASIPSEVADRLGKLEEDPYLRSVGRSPYRLRQPDVL